VYDDLHSFEQDGAVATAPPTPREPAFALRRHIGLENVSFCYPGAARSSLQEVSLWIPHGSVVAFVGASGSGKTTLADVIMGLLPPTSGQVLVDGVDVYSDPSAWQRHIGYIPQAIYLIDDTIRRNIAFGLPDHLIDDVRVWQALRAAQLEALVNSL